MRVEDRIPETLAEAVREKRLVVFCGAGLSAGAPSYLPNWRSLNEFVLDEARSASLRRLLRLSAPTVAAVEALSLTELPVASFSDQLVLLVSGSTWFEILGVLDAEVTNPSHRALAALAEAGTLVAIASTNFDTLIERAFRERGVPLDLFARPADYARKARALPLYKVHGSAGDDASIIDTVTQKVSGLDGAVTARLAELARENHVLFVGYSGADLAIADDYLELSEALAIGPGVSWLVPPGVEPSEAVHRLLGASHGPGSIVAGTLPGFFAALGIDVDEGVPVADAQAEADSRARVAIRAWIADAEISELGCAMFVGRLLKRSGRLDAAREIRAAVAADPELAGDSIALSSIPSLSSLFSLGVDFFEDGEFETARYWLRRHDGFSRGIREFFAAHELELPADVAASAAQTEVVREFDLALCDWHLGELDNPEPTLVQVLALAETAGEQATVAGVHQLRATIAKAEGESSDAVLTYLHRARIAAERAGLAENLLELELEAARLYVRIGEYDRSLLSLDRADGYAQLLGDVARGFERRRTLVLVSLGRGAVAEAAAELEYLIQEAESLDPYVAHSVRWDFCVYLSFHPPLRSRVLEHLDVLDAAERAAAEAAPGTWRSLPNRDGIQAVRDVVDLAGAPDYPLLLVREDRADLGRDLRARIARAEFERELPGLVAVFERLCSEYSGEEVRERFPGRLADMAYGLDAAVRREGDGAPSSLSLMWLGLAASDADPVAAASHYRSSLALGPDPRVLGTLLANFADVLDELGETAEMITVLEQLVTDRRAWGDDAGLARAAFALARALHDAGEPERARAIASEGARATAASGDAELEGLAGLTQPEQDVDAVLGLANALAAAGAAEAAFSTLDGLEGASMSAEQLGRADGIRGQALQAAGRDTEAVEYYERALEAFTRAGEVDLAARAAGHLAVVLRAQGALDRAEAVTIDALSLPSSPEDRANLALTHAGTRQIRIATAENEGVRAELVDELVELLTTAASLGSEETRGLALAQRAQLRAQLGDAEAAAADAADALDSLRAANSVHLRQMEAALGDLAGAR